jgi:hypothetical protein
MNVAQARRSRRHVGETTDRAIALIREHIHEANWIGLGH